MRYIEGVSRHQTSLLPPSLDEFVPVNHPARVIDAFVNSLPIQSLGFTHSQTAATGRKPYHPGDLLKLYVYAYLNQTTSSRLLEKECQRNVEVMWLLKRLAPDFKTIADFRKDNGGAIKQACRQFIVFCREQGLVSGRLVAIDGSKFQAAASKDQVITAKQLAKQIAALDDRIDRYLVLLDEHDQTEPQQHLDTERVAQALSQLQQQREQARLLKDEMKDQGQSQRCHTDPDAKLMRSGRSGMVVGYNMQHAVDEQHQLIVHHEVTDHANDTRQLKPLARSINQILEGKKTIVADAGYSNGEQIQQTRTAETEVVVPSNRAINTQGDVYQKSEFRYLEEDDAYVCPAGKRLEHTTINTKNKMVLYSRTGCSSCALQSKCTKADKRWVSRHFHEDALNRANELATPTLMRARMAIVEPPFGTIKRMLSGRLKCWGKQSISGEYGLAVLSYNLRRAMNVMGNEKLIARMT